MAVYPILDLTTNGAISTLALGSISTVQRNQAWVMTYVLASATASARSAVKEVLL